MGGSAFIIIIIIIIIVVVVVVVGLITILSINLLGIFHLSHTVGGIRLRQGKEIHSIL